MTHDLTLVLIDLVKFLALGFKAKHKPLSVIATLFTPQDLNRNDKREKVELCAKVASIINEWIDSRRIFRSPREKSSSSTATTNATHKNKHDMLGVEEDEDVLLGNENENLVSLKRHAADDVRIKKLHKVEEMSAEEMDEVERGAQSSVE